MKLESDMKSDRTFSGAFALHVRSISVVLSQEAAILNCFLAGNVLIPLKFYLGSTKLVEPQTETLQVTRTKFKTSKRIKYKVNKQNNNVLSIEWNKY